MMDNINYNNPKDELILKKKSTLYKKEKCNCSVSPVVKPSSKSSYLFRDACYCSVKKVKDKMSYSKSKEKWEVFE